MFYAKSTGNPDLDDALDAIEDELQAALRITIGRLDDLLATHPSDTLAIHHHLGDLHNACAQIDANRADRDRHRSNRHRSDRATQTTFPPGVTYTDTDTETDTEHADTPATSSPATTATSDTGTATRRWRPWLRR